MKIAYFGIPHTGGTHTVYKSLRAGLAAHGIEVFWLGVGPSAKEAAEDPRRAKEREQGVVLAGDTGDDKQQALALKQFLESGACDGVFVSAACNRVQSNIPRFLAADVRRIMIVHTITVATYAGARTIRDHVHATVCVSPRIRSDLERRHGFARDRLHVIPNAIDLTRFRRVSRANRGAAPLRLLSLGRIINSDKGVFWLPAIMRRLALHQVQLTIAGDGPDLPELERRCAGLGDRVRFVGRIPAEQVPEILAAHDVFLFPSRFEGLPLSLVEAMAAGCVPVASRIKGVTDFVVRDGEDGLLFDIGDIRAAANAVAGLASNCDRLARLSLAARQNTAGRFDLVNMADAYFEVLSAVMTDPPSIRPPLPMARWSYPSGLRPGLRTRLPTGVKNWLRLWRERLA